MNANFKCWFSSVELFAAFVHFTGSVIYLNIHVLQRRRFVLNVLLERQNTFKFDYKCDDTSAIIFNGTKLSAAIVTKKLPRLWVANFCNNIGQSLFSFTIINHGFLNMIRQKIEGWQEAFFILLRWRADCGVGLYVIKFNLILFILFSSQT
jgi:hypothetical protein